MMTSSLLDPITLFLKGNLGNRTVFPLFKYYGQSTLGLGNVYIFTGEVKPWWTYNPSCQGNDWKERKSRGLI